MKKKLVFIDCNRFILLRILEEKYRVIFNLIIFNFIFIGGFFNIF